MPTDTTNLHSLPLLTVAIPTYNRSEFLELCLKRISEELDSLSADRRKLVKVYVSNNASTDDTDEVISRYRYEGAGGFRVVNNEVNIGGECNVAQCYASATTPYVWVLGDDDVILQGGLQMVLDALDKQNLDILYVNGYSYSDNYLDEPRNGRGKCGIVEYTNASDFVRQTHVMLTFITALIVRTGVKADPDSKVLNGSNLPQLGWVLPLVRDGARFAILKNRIFAAKIANSGGYGAIDVFGRNLNNVANSMLLSRPELAESIQNGAIITWFPTYIISQRKGKSGFSKEDVESELRRIYGGNWRYFLFLVPLMNLPLKLAQVYFLFLRLTRLILRPFLI